MQTRVAVAVFQSDKCHGTIRMTQPSKYEKIKMTFDLTGLQPNQIYALHIHEFGDISNGCHTLGAHFDPFQTKTHSYGEQGHAGDLFNNLKTNARGNFTYTFETDKVSLFMEDVHCIIGRAFVLHQFMDDLGLLGQYNLQTHQIDYYRNLSLSELQSLTQKLGYPMSHQKDVLLQKLESESKQTGNAATRIAFAIIGVAKV